LGPAIFLSAPDTGWSSIRPSLEAYTRGVQQAGPTCLPKALTRAPAAWGKVAGVRF